VKQIAKSFDGDIRDLRQRTRQDRKSIETFMLGANITCVPLRLKDVTSNKPLYLRLTTSTNRLSICRANVAKAVDVIRFASFENDASNFSLHFQDMFLDALNEVTLQKRTYVKLTTSKERKRKRDDGTPTTIPLQIIAQLSVKVNEWQEDEVCLLELKKKKKEALQPFEDQMVQVVPILHEHLETLEGQCQKIKLKVGSDNAIPKNYQLRRKVVSGKVPYISIKMMPQIVQKSIGQLMRSSKSTPPTPNVVVDCIMEQVKKVQERVKLPDTYVVVLESGR
tara:strand:+ start:2147 stop:2986 length:840 start_codon:yes stop_codon:yes gene_type:complete